MHIAVNQNTENHFPEHFELQFSKVFRLLKAVGCDYFYFLGTDGDTSYRFCTYEEWIDRILSQSPGKCLSGSSD